MLTIGKILIILTLLVPMLIITLLGSIGGFFGGSIIGSFIPGGGVVKKVGVGAGVWLLLTFVASIFILIHVTKL